MTEKQNNNNSIIISKNLENNIKYIKEEMGNSSDLTIRQFNLGINSDSRAAMIYINGLVDKRFVQDFMLEISNNIVDVDRSTFMKKNLLEYLMSFPLSAGEVKEVFSLEKIILDILLGSTIIMLEGYEKSISINTSHSEGRKVEMPTSQPVIRGPKEGFVEDIGVNLSLIRKRVKDKNLRIEKYLIGRITKTDVRLVYIKGIADEKIVEEARVRLGRIDIDGILDSGYIEELIKDEPYTPFPTIFSTERPDTLVADLLEGRVAIAVDGSPFILTAPSVLIQFFQASEDYYDYFITSSFIRMLRYLAYLLTMLTPALYIAMTTFHQEMLPTPLLISIAAQREGIPFPVFIEIFIMEIAFEIIRESSTRMPRTVGSTISIVGVLVIGQAAVEAGIISAFVVITVSLTAISSFATPDNNMALSARLLRFAFIILSVTFGLYGIVMGLIVLTLHLCSLRSFGVPYTSPISPFVGYEMKDSIFRALIWKTKLRPKSISKENLVRQGEDAPHKPRNKK